MMGISRIALNKAVENEFGVTAVHLLKQRLLQEIKNDLLFSDLSVKEIAGKSIALPGDIATILVDINICMEGMHPHAETDSTGKRFFK